MSLVMSRRMVHPTDKPQQKKTMTMRLVMTNHPNSKHRADHRTDQPNVPNVFAR